MPGDFSRTLFDPSKHFSGVLMQQGRVQLDSDWNEQLALAQHRIRTETIDVIGPCGAPKQGDSFLIAQTPRGEDLLITPGRFYAGGQLCELNPPFIPITFPQGSNDQAFVPNVLLDGRALMVGQWVEISAAQVAQPLLVQIDNVDPNAPISPRLTFDTDISAYQNAGPAFLRRMVTYGTQADLSNPDFFSGSPLSGPNGGPLTLLDGTYLIYLDAWQRTVNALEDSRIREVALGGPDSTERLQTVWQVKLLPVNVLGSPLHSPVDSPLGSPLTSPLSSPLSCDTDFPAWDNLIAPTTGLVNARTVPPSGDNNPCILPPTAGYQRLENQLYRIEIFQGATTRDQAFFVWSRDNASVETTITSVDGIHLYLHDLGKDEVLGFAKNQWVEIVSRDDELQGTHRFLAQIIQQPDPTEKKVTLGTSAAAYAGRSDLRLRRWDMSGPSVTSNGIPIVSGWIDIEAGVQVQFADGSYATRAFWQIPARTATGEIEWPPYQVPNVQPIPQPPLGIQHSYCKLARLDVINQTWFITDCREHFPSLTTICADDVCYHSQCDMPGVTTVQDALDQLCVASDIRSHNKYLHGWGIVCGLQVTCGPDDLGSPHEHITVHSGRAIDCDGNEIVISKDDPLDALAMLSTVASKTDGTWFMADYDQDSIPDLVFIETANTGTGKVELHIASGKSNYQTRILDTGTTFAPESDGVWLMADYDKDGIPDLVFIKTSNTGTGTVEVHIASGKSGYQTRILETGTTFAPETDGVWLMADYDRDGIPDLVFIKTSNTGTGTVEVHIASGQSNYQTRIVETGTTFAPETDGMWLMADFDQDGIPDLVFIKTSNTGTGTVEVHIASGQSNYQTRILERGTTFAPETDGMWLMADYDEDGIPDLVLVKTSNTQKRKIEVHIASGKSNYQTRILDTGTTFAANQIADGDYCLILDPTVTGRFRFEPYVPATPEPWLDDTLLMDFYNGCIKNLSDFFNAQFTPPPGSTDLISPAQKRLTTIVINLFYAQYSNPDNGSYVYISPTEHVILRDFYNSLRGLLQSSTYCAMFDRARQFPQVYPNDLANEGMNTIFGKRFKTRMRVDPTGSRAYTVGTDNLIHVYDLQQQQIMAELSFPGGSGAVVNDVAFSPDGIQVYVIANLNNADTAFAIATFAAGQHTWGNTTVICGIILLTLATWNSAAGTTMVCTVAAQGLYIFDPTKPSATPVTAYDFNGFGHLVVDQQSNFAYATASSIASTPLLKFDQIVRLDLANVPPKPPTPTPPSLIYSLTAVAGAWGDDTDDIAVVPASQLPTANPNGEVFVTATIPNVANNQLFAFPATGTSTAIWLDPLSLDETSTVRMAYNPVTQFLMLTFEDSYRVKLYRPDTNALENYRGPVQLQPTALAFAQQADASSVYVWNSISSTITTIPAAILDSAKPWPVTTLYQYRIAMINAFLDLLGGALQYLKDCLCDTFLIQCPSCDEDDHLYLACLTVKQGQVFKICNFSKRKYVKSFPTVGYWLSLLPIAPLLHMALEKFCCAALPEAFGKYNAPHAKASVVANPNTGSYDVVYSAKTARSGLALYETTNLKSTALSTIGKVFNTKKFVADSFSHPAMPRAIRPIATVVSSDVLGQSADAAKAKLAASNITVGAVVPYNPGQPLENITRFTTAPGNLQPGSAVSLVTDGAGKVVYYTVMAPDLHQLSNQVLQNQQQSAHNAAALDQVLSVGKDLKAQVDTMQKTVSAIQPALDATTALQNQVTQLNIQLTNLQTTHAQELAARDQNIKALNDQMQAQISTMNDLRTQVQKIAKKGPAGRA
ncbi:MAG TPA: DUF6519 domain-containing protein [Terracidiphilus sp.]